MLHTSRLTFSTLLILFFRIVSSIKHDPFCLYRLITKSHNTQLRNNKKYLPQYVSKDNDSSPSSESISNMEALNVLIGKTLDDAQQMIENETITVNGERINILRPILIDGEHMMGTCDFRLDRADVELAGGKIVKIIKVG